MFKVILSCLTISTCHLAATGENPNLVRNGDFSQIKTNKLVSWATYGHPAVKQKLQAWNDRGNPCAKLTCSVFERKSGSSHALIGQVGLKYPLIKGKLYEFSCRLRAVNIKSHSVVVQIRNTKNWGSGGLNKGLNVGSKWQNYKLKIWATANLQKEARVSVQFKETGTLYIDDVKLIELPDPEIKFTNIISKTNSKNLLPNGNFGIGTAHWTTCGTGMGCSKLERLHGKIVSEKNPAGNNFLRIPMGGKNTPVICFDGWGIFVKKELRPLVENMQIISVAKGQKYTFSCYMRSNKNNTRGALQISELFPAYRGNRDKTSIIKKTVKVGQEWKRYHISFTPKSNYITIGAGPDLKKDAVLYVDISGLQVEKNNKASSFTPYNSVELGIIPSCTGGVFVKGKDKPSFKITVSNHESNTANGTIKFNLCDYFDRKVNLAPLKFSVAPHSSRLFTVKLSSTWQGFFSGKAAWKTQKTSGRAKLRIAIVPKPPQDSILGINHTFAPNWLISQAKKAGVLWYRSWINWHRIEPQPGKYSFERLDHQVDRVIKKGAHMMSILPVYPSTHWSSEKNPAMKRKGNSYLDKHFLMIQPPKNPNVMAEFIGKVVSRYKNKVNTWEFLNEPIYGTRRALPRTHYKPEAYYKLFKIAAKSMRKANPDCKVIGGISGSFYSFPQTSELIKMGMLKYADITNLHLYPRSAPEIYLSPMKKLISVMKKYNCLRPIWVTEFTYTAYDEFKRKPYIASNTEIEMRMLPSERIGADWTLRFFAIMNAYNVKKIFIHAGVTTSPNGLIGGCSLFGYGGAPTKTFAAMAQYINFIGTDFKFIKGRKLRKSAYAYAFKSKGKTVIIMWNSDSCTNLYINNRKGASVYDAMGNLISDKSIKLGSTPIYITGKVKDSKSWLNSFKIR